ncbi:carbohydrate kinase family protein [Paenarthrobacter nicotinovorans]|uniref:carbohydrate kinase family protein n=1 Tax=Paenarthrobacter nicotinovorans TaxID=29320 RepID=UPI002485841C|nr:carbohydrate kinase family protein [Paenarthrobacter nicotinovorans]MDI2019803.1 Ribokinase [Paenarthrobacter nicotinovorans]
MAAPSVDIFGPTSWNHLILLDHLPEPVPHMQFARRSWETIGGTSAGKALHLAGLGVNVRLCSPLGGDIEGQRVRSALTAAGVAVDAFSSEQTERHVNLMTDDGQRVSLYVATPSTPSEHDLSVATAAVAAADIAVVDLSELGALLLQRVKGNTPIWVDLHDYDGSSEFHEPFLCAATTVFMSDDSTKDPWELMHSCLSRGPRLAVCTRGAQGAIALDASGNRYEIDAVPADVVDTNGAGDAFMAGFLAASLHGKTIQDSLTAAVAQARIAIESEHLHPKLAEVLLVP